MREIITKSEKETFEFAKNFAKTLHGGEVITLQGDLGAGKTVFTKGLAKGLGIENNVTSPTFVVMKNYKIENRETKIKELVHVDAYRLSSGEDLKAIGTQEYFAREDCVVVIEWPEKVKKALPENSISFVFKIKKDLRIISIN